MGIRDTIPRVFLLEHTLGSVTNQALEAQQQVKDKNFPVSQGLKDLSTTDLIPARHKQAEEKHEEVDSDTSGGER